MEKEVKKSILKELNMTECELDKAVEGVNTWLNLQPHLPHDIDPTAIRSFIVGCRSAELAKSKLEKYFMARINFPAEIGNRDPMKLEWHKIQPVAFLPDLTADGYLVLVVTIPDLKQVPNFDFVQSIPYVSMAVELIMRERPYITGLIPVVDLKNLSVKLVTRVPPSSIANAIYLLEHVYPFEVKTIINFNTPQIADTLQKTIISPLMNDALYNSIISYTQDEIVLPNHLPREILPKDYGGKAPTTSDIMEEWKKRLIRAEGLFSGECCSLPDPGKIPKQLVQNCNFGSSGTFRKLDID